MCVIVCVFVDSDGRYRGELGKQSRQRSQSANK